MTAQAAVRVKCPHCTYSVPNAGSMPAHLAMAHPEVGSSRNDSVVQFVGRRPEDELACIGSNHVPGCGHFLPDAPVARGQGLLEIPLAEIEVETNVRGDLGDLESLAASIKVHGVLEPIKVVRLGTGRYRVRFGHRRLLAARAAGLAVIPAIVSDGPDPSDTRAVEQLVENQQRRDLGPLEEARAYRTILDGDPRLTQAELARRLAIAPSSLANALRLLETAPEVQGLVSAGKLTAAHAKALAGLPVEDQARIARNAAANGYSAHQVEQDAKAIRDRDAERKRLVKENAAAVTRATEALEAAGVERGTPVHVSVPWKLDADGIRAAVTSAGWPEGTLSWGLDAEEGCDAVGIYLQVQDGQGSIVRRLCASAEHRAAREAAGRAEQDARAARDQAEREELQASIRAVLGGVGPTLGRLMLRWFDNYSGKTWSEYGKLADDEVLDQVARRLSTSYGSKSIPHAKVIAALAAEAIA